MPRRKVKKKSRRALEEEKKAWEDWRRIFVRLIEKGWVLPWETRELRRIDEKIRKIEEELGGRRL